MLRAKKNQYTLSMKMEEEQRSKVLQAFLVLVITGRGRDKEEGVEWGEMKRIRWRKWKRTLEDGVRMRKKEGDKKQND